MTLEQEPTSPWGAYDKMIYRLSDAANVGNDKYRFVIKVYWKTTLRATLKVLPNENNEGVFEISRIVQDQLFVDTPWNTTTEESATNMSGKLFVQYGSESAIDADSAPTESMVGVSTTLDVVAGSFVYEYSDSNTSQIGNYLMTANRNVALSVHPQLTTTSGTFTTPPTEAYKVRNKDYATLTILEQAEISDIRIRFYNAAMNTLGAIYDPGYLQSDIAANDAALHIGVGPENLQSNIPVGTKYYRVYAQPVSAYLNVWFEIEDDCKYEAVRVAWWNKLGGIEYLNFYAASSETRQVERYTYRTYGGNFLTANGNTDAVILADEGVYSAGKTQVKRSIRANTGYVSEYMVDVITDLLQSPRIWIYESQSWQSVLIDGNNVEVKTSLIDKAINYEVTFEYAKYARAVG